MRTLRCGWIALLLLAGPSAAQSFNIDLEFQGNNAGAPPGNYRAALNQPGTWNRAQFNATSIVPFGGLVDITGTATGATITRQGASPIFSGPAGLPACFGWTPTLETALYDYVASTAPYQLNINSVMEGTYLIFTYAHSQLVPSQVRVTIGGTINTITNVCPPTPGLHARPHTFVAHTVVVPPGGGTISIFVTGMTETSPFPLSAIQLRRNPPPVGTNYCVTNGAVISATATNFGMPGTASVTADDLVLQTANAAPEQNGAFFFGPNMIMNPAGLGFQCVGGGVVRIPNTQSGSAGFMYQPVSVATYPQLVVGSTFNFQSWYRVPGGNFDLSDAISIVFSP